jgi:hypothetical protein
MRRSACRGDSSNAASTAPIAAITPPFEEAGGEAVANRSYGWRTIHGPVAGLAGGESDGHRDAERAAELLGGVDEPGREARLAFVARCGDHAGHPDRAFADANDQGRQEESHDVGAVALSHDMARRRDPDLESAWQDRMRRRRWPPLRSHAS